MMRIENRNQLDWLQRAIERLCGQNQAFSLADIDEVLTAAAAGDTCCIRDSERYGRQFYAALDALQARLEVNSLR